MTAFKAWAPDAIDISGMHPKQGGAIAYEVSKVRPRAKLRVAHAVLHGRGNRLMLGDGLPDFVERVCPASKDPHKRDIRPFDEVGRRLI